jgi:hypothetical protein
VSSYLHFIKINLMMSLFEYVENHTEIHREEKPPGSVDLILFNLTLKHAPDRRTLIDLIHKEAPKLLDGREHSLLEIEFMKNREAALSLMGLGFALKVWFLKTPRNMMAPKMSDAIAMEMLEGGYVTVTTTEHIY